jgi:hypothetical protein
VLIWVGGLAALLVVTIPIAASIGPVPIPPGMSWQIIGARSTERSLPAPD